MMKSDDLLKKAIRWTLIALAIIIGPYIIHFPMRGIWLSDDPAHWGTFGDYVGGLFNPLFAFGNLIMLIVITERLTKIEEERANRDRIQNERNTIYPIRQEAVRTLSDMVNRIADISINVPDSKEDIYRKVLILRMDYEFFFTTHKHLFRSLQKYNADEMLVDFNAMTEALEEIYDGFQEKWATKDRKVAFANLGAAVKNISRKRSKVIKGMIADITNDWESTRQT